MITIRETIVRLLAACDAQDLETCCREVRTQATVSLPVDRNELKKVVRAELADMERDGIVQCEWFSLADEPDGVDGDGYYAWEPVQACYDLAAAYA